MPVELKDDKPDKLRGGGRCLVFGLPGFGRGAGVALPCKAKGFKPPEEVDVVDEAEDDVELDGLWALL